MSERTTCPATSMSRPLQYQNSMICPLFHKKRSANNACPSHMNLTCSSYMMCPSSYREDS